MTQLSLHFDRGRQAKVWVGELPMLPTVPEDTILEIDLAAGSSVLESRDVCVEVKIPLGGRRLYGLLGATLVSGDTEQLRVAVPVCKKTDVIFTEAISRPIEDAYSGLTTEFAQAVIAGVSINRSNAAAKPGMLRFNRAAHSLAGSAPIVFRCLAPLVIDLVFAPEEELDVNHLRSRIEAVLERIASGQ